MKFIVDENISLAVVDLLKSVKQEVIYIADKDYAGITDIEVFEIAVKEKAWLITRDYHFTHPIRFPSDKLQGIIYIRPGNLSSEHEASLIQNFLKTTNLESVHGHLITLHKEQTRIRPPIKHE